MNSKYEYYTIHPSLLTSLLSDPKYDWIIAERHSGKRNYELYVKNNRNPKVIDSSCNDNFDEIKARILQIN